MSSGLKSRQHAVYVRDGMFVCVSWLLEVLVTTNIQCISGMFVCMSFVEVLVTCSVCQRWDVCVCVSWLVEVIATWRVYIKDGIFVCMSWLPFRTGNMQSVCPSSVNGFSQ